LTRRSALAALVAVLAAIVVWHVASSRPADAPAATAPDAAAAADPARVPLVGVDPPLPSAAALAAPPSPSASAAAPRLETAEIAVETQIALLAAHRYVDFRRTFLPDVEVTDEAIAACERRVVGRKVLPDWELAEEATIRGRRVRSVSMFGKSMTGFHEVAPGRWLADAVWCNPVMY